MAKKATSKQETIKKETVKKKTVKKTAKETHHSGAQDYAREGRDR